MALTLSTRSYDLFELRGLKLRTEASYQTRTSSFQRTQDEDENLHLSGRVSYDLGDGAFEAGYRSIRREVTRLNRQGIEQLLATPDTPRASLLNFMDQSFPQERKAWVKGTIPLLRKVRIFGRYEGAAVDNPPQSNWVAARSAPLTYTDTKKSQYGFNAYPFQGVDITAERTLEERRISGRGDHRLGQRQRVEHAYVNFHFAFLPRTDLNFQASNFDIKHGDDVIDEGSVEEVTNYSLDLGYSLSDSVTLESNYQRLNHDGVNGAVQEIVGFAVDMGSTSSRGNVRLEYTLDDFHDEAETSSSAKARIVSLSGGMKF